jgi:HK97 family phage portal protein
MAVGLSPIAAAAWSIGEYLNIQQFGLEWFGGGAIPKAKLKNTSKKVDNNEALMMKERFKASVQNGDLFVHGTDWEYDMIQGVEMGNTYIDAKRFDLQDICRFFGCPADLIDAAVSGSSITYANITERNLQFLIHHLGPAITRRESKLSELLPAPRYVKMNTESLLRMDPKAQAETLKIRIQSRTLTVDEAREKMNLPPLTQKQIDEIQVFWAPGPLKNQINTDGTAPADPGVQPDPNKPAEPAKPVEPAKAKSLDQVNGRLRIEAILDNPKAIEP